MIATLALLSVLQTAPDGPAFRLTVAGRPGQTIAITAEASRGWLAAFCTSELCGVGRISLRIPGRGVREIDLHLHRVGDGARHGSVIVREGGEAIVLHY
jgi:hypothetical protein